MTVAFWFWLLMVIWFLFGARVVYVQRNGQPTAYYWGIGWNLLLFLLFCLVGLRIFPHPFETLVSK